MGIKRNKKPKYRKHLEHIKVDKNGHWAKAAKCRDKNAIKTLRKGNVAR